MDRYVKDAVDGMEGKCAGRRLEPAMVAGNKAVTPIREAHILVNYIIALDELILQML